MREVRPELTPSRNKQRSDVRIPQMPLEWFDSTTWRLPSGKALAEFALQAGFLAPLLLHSDVFSKLPSSPVARKSKALEKEGNR